MYALLNFGHQYFAQHSKLSAIWIHRIMEDSLLTYELAKRANRDAMQKVTSLETLFGMPQVMAAIISLGCNWWSYMHQIDT